MQDSFLTTLVELWAKYRFPVYEDILGIEPKNKYLQISKTYQKKKFIENWFVIVFTGLVISFHNAPLTPSLPLEKATHYHSLFLLPDGWLHG